MKINILVVGQGAREHALAWRCQQSPLCGNIYTDPGNPAIETIAQSIEGDRFSDMAKRDIGLFIFGPEVLIARGKSDDATNAGFKVFAPSIYHSLLEASKCHAKSIMLKRGIPTGDYGISPDRKKTETMAQQFLHERNGVVLKASGLAGGKGVFVCRSSAEVNEAIDTLYESKLLEASDGVVVEEIIEGRECSFFTLLGHGDPHHLGFVVDYKRLKDNDQGPNTGGMGSYYPVPWLPADAEQQVIDKVITPLEPYLVRYVGCLYVGLMWTDSGPKVLEFNVRFGDPETQALALGYNYDWLPIIADHVGYNVDLSPATGDKKPTVAVVLTSPSYPYTKDTDSVRLPRSLFTDNDPDCQIFGASINRDSDERYLRTGSGRVLTVVASGKSQADARQRAYSKVEQIVTHWPQAHFRKDIGEH